MTLIFMADTSISEQRATPLIQQPAAAHAHIINNLQAVYRTHDNNLSDLSSSTPSAYPLFSDFYVVLFAVRDPTEKWYGSKICR